MDPTKKSEQFKQFDAVVDYSDHQFAKQNQSGKVASISKSSTKKIMQEWKILEEHLPESIFVRVYETRIDLLRAVIVGSNGTPYQNGLFFFDFCFGSDYPSRPPKVYYRSYGLRINPNLYESGFVCLSLLNTWLGNNKSERWNPSKSTILQVLVSIQALVLNEKPYFNEPFNATALLGRHYSAKKSLVYNEDVFVMCCKTMLFLLSKPPMHFEGFVAEHFRERAESILFSCKPNLRESDSGCSWSSKKVSKKFKVSMDLMYPRLLNAFINNGSSLGHFVEQLKEERKENEKSRSQSVVKKKGGLMSKLKRVLTFNKVGITESEIKK